MKIKQVLEALERFAPLPLQESWDNAGLQIGLTEAEVSGALLCLDVTEAVVDEAIRRGCNLIVSHHPLLFRGLKQVADMNDVQRTVRRAIKEDICVVSMHTNLDNAQDGVNFKIAEKLTPPLVPPRKERGEAPPLTPPRVERGIKGMGDEQKPGQWVMLTLEAPMESRTFVEYVKERMEAQCAMCNELLHRPIQKVAICGGAGDFLLDEVIAAGADAFVTGEMHYHQYFGHEQEIQICVIGHYESEHFTTEVLRDVIERGCPGVRCCIAETNTNPIRYY
ncbi:MAG: Nif3-like dinuclear metal center hexameric protein [Prevotella sp.]|nr:Nif3-like dinuclear metal center hexameric protein [Prevotella sp.]